MNQAALKTAITTGIEGLPAESLREIADYVVLVRLRSLHSSAVLQSLIAEELKKLSKQAAPTVENLPPANGVKAQQDEPEFESGFGVLKDKIHLLPGWDEPLELIPHGDKLLPGTPATEKPGIGALAGIWKDKDITLEKLRKEAWGDLQGASMPKGPVTLPPGFDEPLENYPAGFGGAKGMFVMSPDFDKLLENDPSGFGCLKDLIHLAPDWDEPLEDFKEYMY